MRRCRRLCFQFPGGSGGAVNPFAGLMDPTRAAGTNRFDGNFQGGGPFGSLDPGAMTAMAEHMKRSMTPEMQQNLQQMMSGMTSGKQDFGKMGVMAFGVGENERGKKVARGAKLEFDPATGKMTTDFHEEQIDPDDAMLSESAEAKAAAAAPCTEVQFEEDTKHLSGKSEEVLETEIEFEPIPVTKKKQ